MVLITAVGPDRGLAQLASVQRGCVSRTQLAQLGYTNARVQTLVRHGWLQRLHQGVYAVGHRAELPLRAETAALLAVHHPSAISHLSALRLHGLLPAQPHAPIEITVGDRHNHECRPGIRLHRTQWLPPGHVRLLEGLPVSAPERALLDSAPLLSPRQLERALDEALAIRLTSPAKLFKLVADGRGYPGHARLAAIVGERRQVTVTESQAEERFLALIRDAGLPPPLLQAELYGYRIDAYWPESRFAVEIDGFQWHVTKTAFERDRRKQRVLQDHGIEVSRITWHQIVGEPLPLIAHVARRIALRLDRDRAHGRTASQ